MGPTYSNQNIFKDEEKSLVNLQYLAFTPVGYNSCKDIDPWDQSLLEIKQGDIFPAWFYKYYNGYNCTDRLIILAQKNRYQKSGYNKKYRFMYIGGGYMIDLKQNIQYQINNPERQRQILFKRDKYHDSKAKRPKNSSRFTSDAFEIQNTKQEQTQNDKKETAQPRKILFSLGKQFWEQNGKKNPSTKQIFDGLITEMKIQLSCCSKLKETKEQIEMAICNHTQAWKFIFDCLGLEAESEEEILLKVLQNHDSIMTKSILFLYSMETFLPYQLNQAERMKDSTKVQSFGPFALALDRISQFAQSERTNKVEPSQIVYRGVKLYPHQIQEYKENLKVRLWGFTSTSLVKEEAIQFMFQKLKPEQVPVLYEIKNLSKKGWHYFKLDTYEYSIFPYEQEVLIQSGSLFDIINTEMTKLEDGREYLQIKLSLIDELEMIMKQK